MLDGLRAIDLSGELGWLAGRVLADLGMDVVKVEPPAADLSSAGWRAFNANKRLLRLDLATPDGVAALEALLADADLLIETATPGSELAAWLAPDRIATLNPALVHVSITPFGRTGPRAQWLGSDIEVMAAGGAMSLAGEADGAPMRVSAPQARSWAGAQAATGALTALVHRGQCGLGQHVDVSAQAAVVTALAHAPTFHDITGRGPTRCGAFVSGRALSGARFRAFWPCADGHINFVLYGGAAGRRSNQQLAAWMREAGAALGALADITWKTFDPKTLTQAQVDALEAPIAAFLATLHKRDFLRGASEREMLGYPVSTVEDIAGDEQLQARGFWHDFATAPGRTERHCGAFALIDGERTPLRHAPGEPVALDRLQAQWRAKRAALGAAAPCADALSGLKVVEFASYAAGPHAGKMLANHGATVVHVESRQRPDGFRLEYPPFKDEQPGIDRGGCFAYFNDSKYGVTLDLKNDAALALARELVRWCDVVIENMRPGVMERLGLSWSALREINPRLIMLSSCNMGQTGPRANTPGFGSQLSALAGFCELTGEPGGLPMLLYGPYIDFIASTLGAAAVLAALVRRQRNGRGAHIDLAQYESGLLFVGAELLDYHTHARVAARAGNRDADATPHGAHRCSGGGWLAVSCWSDAEFARLALALGEPGLARDERFATAPARRQHRALLQGRIDTWCLERGADAAATALQQGGVHAYRVNTVAELFDDAQLRHRRVWRRRHHAVIGAQAYCFPAFELSATPGDISAAGPLLGADNEMVFRDMLGLDAAQYAAYEAQGAFG